MVEYEQRILECLDRYNLGLTIIEISKEIEGNRNTVSKYLSRLESKNLVFKKEVGKANLYFLRDIGLKILNYVQQKPSGVSIADIANSLRVPKNFVKEQVEILTTQEKLKKKKIGSYFLYFSSETNFVPKTFMISFYKALISDLKDKFPNNEAIFKEIGRNIFESVDFSMGNHLVKKLYEYKTNPIIELHLEVFKDVFPSFYSFESIDISTLRINDDGKKQVFRLKNSEFLDEKSLYHFYILAGMIEIKMSNDLNKKISCNIVEFDFSGNKNDNYIDIAIEIE